MKQFLVATALGLAVVLSACTATQPARKPAPSELPVTTTTATSTPTPPRDKPAKRTPAKASYSCEPSASAKFDDPANPNVITNKDCPAIGAAKERAAKEFANCESTGGAWNVNTQRCTYPPNTKEPSPPGVDSTDPNFRDANGETYEEYCARIGYSGENLRNCPAG